MPQNSLPAPSADPIPFFDPVGNVDLLYVDDVAHVILLSQNDPVTALWRHVHGQSAWRPYVATDLSALSGVSAANGLASILVNGLSANRHLPHDQEHDRNPAGRLGTRSPRSVT